MWAGWGARERDLNCDLLVFSEKGSLVGGTNIWKHPEDLVWLRLLGSLHHGPSTTVLPSFFHQLPDVELLNLEGWCTRQEMEVGLPQSEAIIQNLHSRPKWMNPEKADAKKGQAVFLQRLLDMLSQYCPDLAGQCPEFHH